MPNTKLNDLSPNARELAEASMAWCDACYDSELGLLTGVRNDFSVGDVRNSIWYAVGLLLRGGEGDDARAARTIEAILERQFDEPGMPYHGTFARNTAEDHPPYAEAVMWQDYDPNWRQFIGVGLAIVAEEYESRLPGSLMERVNRALNLAVEGEPVDRCSPRYSNIALMKAGLNVYVGKRMGRKELTTYGEAFGREVYEAFRECDAFGEYNSPTYYGVNLYALGFWRRYLTESGLHALGAEMEAGLWRDTSLLYHADLQNLCGPFTRSYGMDMAEYTAIISQHIWMACEREAAPLPPADKLDWEFAYGPCLALLGVDVPVDAAEAFYSFGERRLVLKQITKESNRVVSAWLDDTYMIGAESSAVCTPVLSQFRPVTAHWKTPDGSIGWIWLIHYGPVDGQAEEGLLTIRAPVEDTFRTEDLDSAEFTFRIHTQGVASGGVQRDRWNLPGMTVSVETNAAGFRMEEESGDVIVVYVMDPGEAMFELRFDP